MPAEPQTPAPRVSPDVLKAVIDAYYPDAVAGANQARSRAAAGQSIASFLVGTIVGLISINGLAESASVTKFLAFLSAILWSVVSVLFFRAVAAPVRIERLHAAVDSDDEIVRIILERSKAERAEIDKRQALAGRLLYGALGSTLATALVASVVSPPGDWSHAILTATPEQVSALTQECPNITRQLSGDVNTGSLDGKTFEFKVSCGGSMRMIELDSSSLKRLVIVKDE